MIDYDSGFVFAEDLKERGFVSIDKIFFKSIQEVEGFFQARKYFLLPASGGRRGDVKSSSALEDRL